MQIFIIFQTMMVAGLMAMPLKIHGIRSLANHVINDKTSKMTERMNFEPNIKILENDIDVTNFKEQTSRNKEGNQFLHDKNSGNLTSMTAINSNSSVKRLARILSVPSVYLSRVMSGPEPQRKHVRRALHQTPSGFRLDGKHKFPYFNQKSISHLNRLMSSFQPSSSKHRLSQPYDNRNSRLPIKFKHSST
ncbi:BgtE-5724 [Blumeria graminis f. sp. tritici]|uniref:BgtE-5724 n=2 Tax=Blumeria graminis f. sp. tritici TaxID=62690 RepID=A0A9X9MMW0_BLUGR|nr:putative secreted effector protein [Blumeria graminis f. sp. tritici 96224]VDB93656.1 BgtE-5724 [Blumeria graminis f. sp. tritici]